MSAVYFVRQLGKVRGPFASDHLSRLVTVGLIGPTAEVSTDRVGWYPFAAHPDFGSAGEPAPMPQRRPPRLPTVAVPQPMNDDFELDLSGLMTPTPVEAGTGSEWFDSVDLGAMDDGG